MTYLPAIAAAVLAAPVFAVPAGAQEDAQLYECTAKARAAGQQEPSLTSPAARMPDGEDLRVLKAGDSGYASVAKGAAIPEWIELYGAMEGHGSSFLGFYQSKFFDCGKVER